VNTPDELRPTAGAAFLKRDGEALSLGPLRVSKRRLRRARGRAGADVEAANALLRQTLARLRGQGDKDAKPRLDRRPDGSPVSPPLPAPVQRVPEPDRNGAGSPLEALKERWRDAVREGKLAAREKETEIRAQYERRVRHDPRLHAQHHGVLPPPRPEAPDTTPRQDT
jgi:hypothetical protein